MTFREGVYFYISNSVLDSGMIWICRCWHCIAAGIKCQVVDEGKIRPVKLSFLGGPEQKLRVAS